MDSCDGSSRKKGESTALVLENILSCTLKVSVSQGLTRRVRRMAFGSSRIWVLVVWAILCCSKRHNEVLAESRRHMSCFASPQLRTFGAYMAGTRRTSGYRICECSSAHVGSHVDIVSDALGRKRLKYNHDGWGTWEYYARNPASVPSAPETKQAWRVNYIRRGETGPPIVFVHGFGASSFHWRYSLAKTTVLLICCPPGGQLVLLTFERCP